MVLSFFLCAVGHVYIFLEEVLINALCTFSREFIFVGID